MKIYVKDGQVVPPETPGSESFISVSHLMNVAVRVKPLKWEWNALGEYCADEYRIVLDSGECYIYYKGSESLGKRKTLADAIIASDAHNETRTLKKLDMKGWKDVSKK